jgi:predicted GNAT family acetyltransferase
MSDDGSPVEVHDDPDAQRYLATIDGAPVGSAFYTREGARVTFTHTEVSDAFGGRGVGGALAKAALDDARARNEQVVPQCPFIARYIARHPDYLALVPEPLRADITAG